MTNLPIAMTTSPPTPAEIYMTSFVLEVSLLLVVPVCESPAKNYEKHVDADIFRTTAAMQSKLFSITPLILCHTISVPTSTAFKKIAFM